MDYYIVTFDRIQDKSYEGFHDDFVNHAEIKRWWHYIKNCYIIGTDMGEDALANHFIETAKKNDIRTTHLVLKVKLANRQGMLTEKAWNWMRRNT